VNAMASLTHNPSADMGAINWDALPRAVTYQVYANEILGWVPVSSHVYRQLTNPNTRRILLKDEQKIINSTLMDTK
jgi:2-polyprenyl-3-methyl-5-hydroxy-6-metoxy-1,4-benzoquinol methylase